MRDIDSEVLMRSLTVTLLVVMFSLPLAAQSPQRRRMIQSMTSAQPGMAESAVKQAMEQLVTERKLYDRDLSVLQHLRAADVALTDPMQPNNAIQKAIDEVQEAKNLEPEFLVKQGVIKMQEELEGARRSPIAADFGRLRGLMRTEAIGPAVRLVARNGAKLQEDTLAWIKVQELISSHLRTLAEITAESLRAAQQ